MLRLRSNCNVTTVEPSELTELICATPAIWPNWRSSGVATVAAMVSGLAPGTVALTWMVGKSTCGSGATGNSGKATMPTSASAAINSDVAIGRRMKTSEMFISSCPPDAARLAARPAADSGS